MIIAAAVPFSGDRFSLYASLRTSEMIRIRSVRLRLMASVEGVSLAMEPDNNRRHFSLSCPPRSRFFNASDDDETVVATSNRLNSIHGWMVQRCKH
jgi:hypothetical protein